MYWNVHGWRRGSLNCELQHCTRVHAYVQPRWWRAVPGESLAGVWWLLLLVIVPDAPDDAAATTCCCSHNLVNVNNATL